MFHKKTVCVLLLLLGSFGIARSQTWQAPDLQCVNVLSNGDIFLTWSNPAPDACGPFIGYVIYGSTNQSGPYIIIDTVVNQLQTTYIIADSVGTWFFFMESLYACPGYIALTSDTVDTQKPLPPVIDYVTVVSSTNTLIQFQHSASPDAFAYIIYIVIGGVNFPLDTIFANTNQYIDSINNPNVGALTYLIAAMDSCGNTGLISTVPHNTLFNYAITTNCSSSARLVWNAYNNWVGGVDHYEVFVSYNNQPTLFLLSTNDTTAVFNYSADSMCFSVLAYSDTSLFTSASNIYCLPPNPSSPVQDFYIRNVTVAGTGVIDIFYSLDAQSDLRTLKLERGNDGINFNAIAVIDVPADLSVINYYSDSTPLTNELSYYYRFEAQDSCGAKTYSTIGKSIWLDGGAYSSLVNHLEWETFFVNYGEVVNYTVFRKVLNTFDSVTTVSFVQNDYEESAAPFIDKNGTLCYLVIATDTLNFPNGIIDTVRSSSNELCIDQLVKILVPNAFAPNGVNTVFKPVLRFADNKTYLFQVYNRWGGLLFSTKNSEEGWDGFYQGRLVEQGVYAYLVQVVDNEGYNSERKGTVMLLR